MSELTVSTSGSECLDLEDLAAFADGRLTGAERERAVEHLADCERCYEVLAEVMQIQEEEEGDEDEVSEQSPTADDPTDDEPLAEVVVHPSSRPWLWPTAGVAAAAALIVMVAAPLVRDDRRPPPAAGWDEHPWIILRSGPQEVEPEALAFRLGVWSIDLEVALEATRTDRAEGISELIQHYAAGLEQSTDVRERLEDLRARLQADVPPAKLARQARRVAGLLEDLAMPPPYFELGRWVEEGRAAALVGDRSFFESRDTDRFLQRMKSFEPAPDISVTLSKELIPELKTIRSLIDAELTDDQLARIEESLARIIQLAGT